MDSSLPHVHHPSKAAYRCWLGNRWTLNTFFRDTSGQKKEKKRNIGDFSKRVEKVFWLFRSTVGPSSCMRWLTTSQCFRARFHRRFWPFHFMSLSDSEILASSPAIRCAPLQLLPPQRTHRWSTRSLQADPTYRQNENIAMAARQVQGIPPAPLTQSCLSRKKWRSRKSRSCLALRELCARVLPITVPCMSPTPWGRWLCLRDPKLGREEVSLPTWWPPRPQLPPMLHWRPGESPTTTGAWSCTRYSACPATWRPHRLLLLLLPPPRTTKEPGCMVWLHRLTPASWLIPAIKMDCWQKPPPRQLWQRWDCWAPHHLSSLLPMLGPAPLDEPLISENWRPPTRTGTPDNSALLALWNVNASRQAASGAPVFKFAGRGKWLFWSR